MTKKTEAEAAEAEAAEAKAAEAKAAEAVKPAKRTRRVTAKTIKAVAGDVMVCGVIKVTAEGVELDAKVQSNRKIMKHINYGVEIGTLAWVK